VQAGTIMKTQGAKLRGEPSTVWHGVDLIPICYATRSTPLEWQTDCFIWTVSCDAVRGNKSWNKKIHVWFH